MRHYIVASAFVIAYVFSTPLVVSASLLDGQTVEYQYLVPTITTPYSVADNGNKLVGAGVEVSNIVDGYGIMNISDTNLYVDFTGESFFTIATGDTFNGFRITDIFGAIPSFTSVSINAATNMVGFDASAITFDADHIWVNWISLGFNANTVVSLDINSVPNSDPGSIPEPSTLAIWGILGGLGMIAARRRRKRVA